MKIVCKYLARSTSSSNSPLTNYSQPYTTWQDFYDIENISFFGFDYKFGNQEKETIVNITKEVFFRDKK